MASIVSAGTTSATALNMSADTTGILQLASNNGTVALTIGTSQNIGFGTTSPNFECHISTGSTASITQPTAGSYGLYVQQNTSGSVGGIYIQDGASNSGNSLVIADNNGAIRVIVDGDGNLGLSVNTPSSIGKLAISGTVGLANNSALRFYNSNNTNWSVIDCPATDGTGPLRFTVGSGEAGRFDNSGNFLIGTSTTDNRSGTKVQTLGSSAIVDSSGTVANGGTLVLTANSSGASFTGFLAVSNVTAANAAVRTQTLYAIMGRGTSNFTATQLGTVNGSTGGASFTLTCPSFGALTVTNTSGSTTVVNMTYIGHNGG